MADGKVTIDVTVNDNNAEKSLMNVEDAALDTAGGLEDLGSAADDAGKGLDTADIAAGALVANGLSALVGKLGEAVSSLVGLADETREYREDMAKLDSAFTTAGHSTETASKAYDGFYKILGESDRTVEAVNHLAEFTTNEKELAQWSTIAAGVTAKFGDSLPIEGLTEAANETAKVGAVTGPLADALTWAGISEDEFNKKLAACNSEQERASLITSTLNGEYAAAAEEYNKLTANTQAARDATNNMEQAQAALGAAIEPVTTAWTNMKANALQWLVDTGLPAIQNGWQWVLDNLPAVTLLVGTLATAWLTFGGAQKIVDGWNKVMAISQAALNAVMNANPIGLIIMAITALVAAFLILWNNCEGFRNFWIGLWEGIKTAVGVVVDWFVTTWEDTLKWFNEAIAEIEEFFSDAWTGIKNVFAKVGEFFSGVWTSIKNAFGAVKEWFSGIFSDAWQAVKDVFSNWGSFFSGLWDTIKSTFSKLGSNIADAIGGAVKSGINGVISLIEKTINKAISLINGGIDLINLIPGVSVNHVSSVELPRLARGGVLKKGQVGLLEGSGAEAVVPLEKNTEWLDKIAKRLKEKMSGMSDGLMTNIRATVNLENARFGSLVHPANTGLSDLANAVGTQTAGINSLSSSFRSGTANKRPIIIQLNDRELGRAIVDVGGIEETRIGAHLSYGGAK